MHDWYSEYLNYIPERGRAASIQDELKNKDSMIQELTIELAKARAEILILTEQLRQEKSILAERWVMVDSKTSPGEN